jgi:hypothetical protein
MSQFFAVGTFSIGDELSDVELAREWYRPFAGKDERLDLRAFSRPG